MVSMKNSDLKELIIVLFIKSNFDAGYLALVEENVSDFKLRFPRFKHLIDFLKGSLKIDKFVGTRYQTNVDIRTGRPQARGKRANHFNT